MGEMANVTTPDKMLDVLSNVDIELVTPELAEKMLAGNYNPAQRSATQQDIDRYAADMLNGTWDETLLEVISLTPDGVLVDGQHRLMAIVQTGKPTWCYINRRATLDQFSVIDSGKARRLEDRSGVPNGRKVSAVARVGTCLSLGSTITSAMNNNIPVSSRPGIGSSERRKNRVVPPTNSELLAYIRANEQLLETIVSRGQVIRRHLRCGSEKQINSALLIIKLCMGMDAMEEFADVLTVAPFTITTSTLQQSILFPPKPYAKSKGPQAKQIPKNIINLLEVLYCFDRWDGGNEVAKITVANLRTNLKKWDARVRQAYEAGDIS